MQYKQDLNLKKGVGFLIKTKVQISFPEFFHI